MSAYETATSLPEPLHRGKVRDVYGLGDRLLLVATDLQGNWGTTRR